MKMKNNPNWEKGKYSNDRMIVPEIDISKEFPTYSTTLKEVQQMKPIAESELKFIVKHHKKRLNETEINAGDWDGHLRVVKWAESELKQLQSKKEVFGKGRFVSNIELRIEALEEQDPKNQIFLMQGKIQSLETQFEGLDRYAQTIQGLQGALSRAHTMLREKGDKDLTKRIEELERITDHLQYEQGEKQPAPEELSVDGILKTYDDGYLPDSHTTLPASVIALWKLKFIADYVNDGWVHNLKSKHYYYPLIDNNGKVVCLPNLSKDDMGVSLKDYSPIKINPDKWEKFIGVENIIPLIKEYLS